MPGITDLPTFNNENDLGTYVSYLDNLKSIHFFFKNEKVPYSVLCDIMDISYINFRR